MKSTIKYGLIPFLLAIISLNSIAQECNVLSKANDITPDKYCAPVHVDWKITYRGVMNVAQHSDISYEVDWGDGTVVNIPFGNLPGTVNHIGGSDYQANIEHIYPEALDGSCNYQPRVWLRIADHTCMSSVQEQNVTVWDVDNANGGELVVEDRVVYVCVGEDTTVVFNDVSNWNCVPPDEEDNINNQSRWIQWEYGTGATTLTDIFIDGIPFAGTFSDAVNKLPGPVETPQLPYSRSRTIYVPPTDASDIGKEFEVTLNNWNFCNQYPGNDPVSQTARIVVVDIPTASISFNTVSEVCLGEEVRVSGHPGGGVWSTPSGAFENPNQGRFNSDIAGPGVHDIIYTYVGTGDCIAEAHAQITVYPNPSIFISNTDPTYLCPGTSFQFTNMVIGGTAPYSYMWDRDSDPLSATDILNPQFMSTTPGSYSVRLNVEDHYGCKASRNRNFIVSEVDLSFDINALELCRGDVEVLNMNVSGGAGSYTYVWSGDIAYLSGPDNAPSFNANDVGTFKLYCKVIDDIGCEMTDSVEIEVNAMPAPDIVTPDMDVCGLETVVEIVHGSGTLSWTVVSGPGHVAFSDLSSGQTQIAVNKPGNYVIKLAEESNGCEAGDEIAINFTEIPKPFAGSDAAVCGNEYVLNAKADMGSGSWVIESAPGVLAFDDQFDDKTKIIAGAPGTYTLVWREENNGCIARDTVEVTFNAIPVPDFDMNHNGSCSPLMVDFVNKTVGGQDYLWHFQAASYSNDVNPQYTFDLPDRKDTTFIVTLEVESAEGCKESLQKSIKVNPNPLAKILSSYKPACSPINVEFGNGSIGGTNYTWDYGDGFSELVSDKSSVNHVFVNDTSDNQVVSYTVNLVAENSYGCTDTTSTFVLVYPQANFQFTFSNNPICESSNVVISADGGAKSYSWDFGNGKLSSGANPTVFADYTNNSTSDTMYQVRLDAVSYYGCPSSFADSIMVHPKVVAGFIASEEVSDGELELTLSDDSKNGKYVYIKWGDGDIDSLVMSDFPIEHSYVNNDFFPKLYNVTYVVASESGCLDSTGMQVRVYPGFEVDFEMPEYGCSPVEVSFINNSTPAGTFEWDFGDGSPVESRLFPMHKFENTKGNGEPDTFTVRLSGESMWGFTDTVYKDIIIYPVPTAKWNITATNKPDDEVVVENVSEFGDVYYWDLDDGDFDTTMILTTETKSFGNINPEQIIKHLSLKVENAYGCSDSIAENVTVNPIIVADFDVDSVACSPLSTVAYSTSTGAVFYEWALDGGPFVRSDVRYPIELENSSDTLQVHTLTLRVESVYGDQDVVSKDIYVYPVPVARMAGNMQGPSPFNIVLNNLSEKANAYEWTFMPGDVLLKSDESDADYVYVNGTGLPVTREVKLRAENTFGCVDSTSEMAIVYPNVKADFECPSQGCPPLQVKFKDKSQGALFYEWQIKNVNTFYGSNLSYEFKNDQFTDSIYEISLIVESAYGYRDTMTKTIRVLPMVKALFDATSGGLSPFESQLENNSVNVLESYWNYGDGSPVDIVPADQNLTHLYSAGASPEAFDVALKVLSPEGCMDSAFSTVMVYPDLAVSFVCDTIGCSPFDVDFINQSVGVDLYEWTFGDGSSKWMSKNAFRRYVNNTKLPQSFEAKLIGQSKYGFVDSMLKTIIVNPAPKALFNVTPEGESPLNAIIADENEDATLVVWDMDDGNILTNPGVGFNHLYINNTGGPLNFDVKQKVENTYGCPDSFSQTVTVFPAIDLSFECDSVGCSPLTVMFKNTSSGALRYKWDFGDGTDVLESSSPVHVFINPFNDQIVTYTVTMIGYSQFGYTDTISKEIRVNPVPKSSFDLSSTQGCSPHYVTFANNSVGASYSEWLIGDDSLVTNSAVINKDLVNPSFLPRYFDVKLSVRNNYGCEADTMSVIEVFPKVIASFDGDTMGCSPLTAIYINKSRNATDFIWNIDGLEDERANPVLPYENMSTEIDYHTIKLKAWSNYGCEDSMTKVLAISPEPTIDFAVLPSEGFSPLNVVIENKTLHADSYLWSLGEGDTIKTLSNDPIEHTYVNNTLAPGVRKINLLASNSFGCEAQLSKTVDIYPQITAYFESVSEGCSPLTVDFKNLSSGATSFEWFFDDGTPVSVASNPTHTFVNQSLSEVRYYQVKLLAYSQYGMADTFISQIEVYPTPESGFELNTISGCSPLMLNVKNECLGKGSILWDFGLEDPFVSSDASFERTYTNMSANPDYYNIVATITNEFNCFSRTQKALEVLPGVVAEYVSDTAGCSPLTLVFRNMSVNAAEYEWDMGDGTVTMEAHPIKKYVNKSAQDFREFVTLVAKTKYGCRDTFKQKIAVYPEPDFDFEVEPAEITLPISEITINADIKNEGPWRFLWDFGDGSTSTGLNPGAHTYSDWGKYNIKVDITDERCSDVQFKGVTVNPSVPVAEFTAPAMGCTPVTMNFRNYSEGKVANLWNFGDGTLSSDENPEHTYYRPGQYDVMLVVFNDVGDADTMIKEVNVYEGVKADFLMTPHVVHSFAQEIRFTNFSQNGYSYIWDFGDGDISHDFEPVKRYSKEGVFDISLVVVSEQGCKDTMFQASALEVSDVYNVRFPNVFIPYKSGAQGDAYNDGDTHIFYPLIDRTMLKEYRLAIFDRWGLMVFETKDVDKGWDGYYNNKLCQQGVYVWKVHAVFEDGNEVVKTGDVTLLK